MPFESRPDAVSHRSLLNDADALLRPAEAASLLALSVRTLEGLRLRGGGPPFVRLQRSVRYRRGDLIDWVLNRRIKSTADAE
jgi:hypothetical protein